MRYPKIRRSEPVQARIDNEEDYDPYLNESPPPTDPVRCPSCGNIYYKKTWHRWDQIELDDETLGTHTCPGCRKVEDGYFLGELTVKGKFLKQHHDEISHLIQNEIYRTQEDNPLSKVVEVDVEGDAVKFKLTNRKLGERIGRELKKAYQGEFEKEWSDRITRVTWSRDDVPGEDT